MSDARKRTWIIFITWSIVLIGFIILFFSVDDLVEWTWIKNRNKRIASAILLALGYVIFFIIQVKKKKERRDERTFLIELKASKVTMPLISMYVFLFGISLFVAYENEFVMPVSWVWFIAYTTIFLTYILYSGLYLWFDKRVDGYGKY